MSYINIIPQTRLEKCIQHKKIDFRDLELGRSPVTYKDDTI